MIEEYLDQEALQALHEHYDIQRKQIDAFLDGLRALKEKPKAYVCFEYNEVDRYFLLEKEVVDIQIERYEKKSNNYKHRANAYLDAAARLDNYKPEGI